MENKDTELDILLKREMKYEEKIESCSTCEYSYPLGIQIRCNFNRACHLFVSPKGRCRNWRKEDLVELSQVLPQTKIHDEGIIGGDNPSNEEEIQEIKDRVIKDRIGPDIEPTGEQLNS